VESEKLRKLEKRVERLEQQNRKLKKKVKEESSSGKISESSREVSRRSFLKKLGAGMISIGALSFSSVSALNIRSEDLQFYGGSEEENVEFEVGSDGSVVLSNTLDLGNNRITGLSDPSSDSDAVSRGWVESKTGGSKINRSGVAPEFGGLR
jgi:hypothetical protein